MTTQTKPLNQTKKEVVFPKIKVHKDHVKYKALVGNYVVRGLTSTKAAAIDVVERIANAEADLIDMLKVLVDKVTDNVVSATESGTDVWVAIGTTFHLTEYMLIAVKLQRAFHVRVSKPWWGEVVVMFKGSDGYKTFSKHVVKRYVEFDKVTHDRLYKVIYEAARMAFNAYSKAHKRH